MMRIPDADEELLDSDSENSQDTDSGYSLSTPGGSRKDYSETCSLASNASDDLPRRRIDYRRNAVDAEVLESSDTSDDEIEVTVNIASDRPFKAEMIESLNSNQYEIKISILDATSSEDQNRKRSLSCTDDGPSAKRMKLSDDHESTNDQETPNDQKMPNDDGPSEKKMTFSDGHESTNDQGMPNDQKLPNDQEMPDNHELPDDQKLPNNQECSDDQKLLNNQECSDNQKMSNYQEVPEKEF
ncbi:uncharacterized protein [Diabrotica undecimpunctata]|uniref:uncharacterized protein n=1 Tax=Diabrotica undecimpunctata TaxID=50387 RepID=UPI003B63A804